MNASPCCVGIGHQSSMRSSIDQYYQTTLAVARGSTGWRAIPPCRPTAFLRPAQAELSSHFLFSSFVGLRRIDFSVTFRLADVAPHRIVGDLPQQPSLTLHCIESNGPEACSFTTALDFSLNSSSIVLEFPMERKALIAYLSQATVLAFGVPTKNLATTFFNRLFLLSDSSLD